MTWAQQLKGLCTAVINPLFDNVSEYVDVIDHDILQSKTNAIFIRDYIIAKDPLMERNISRFQKHCLEFFNEAYYAVSEYMWMPLLAWDEMQWDELYIATLEILDAMGIE